MQVILFLPKLIISVAIVVVAWPLLLVLGRQESQQ